MLLQLSKTVKQSPKSPQIFENNGAFCADRPFSKNRSETNCQKSFVFNQLVSELQSYILSTTTETLFFFRAERLEGGFNRTSFQQQLKLGSSPLFVESVFASIVHPFNNNWNVEDSGGLEEPERLQSYILSTTTETLGARNVQEARKASIVHPFNNNWNDWPGPKFQPFTKLQSYILSTTTETKRSLQTSRQLEASIVHPFNNNWNFGAWCFLCISRSFNRTSFQQQLKRF